MTNTLNRRLLSLLLTLCLLISAGALLPVLTGHAGDVDVELGVVIYGDVNEDEDFDLTDVSCLFHKLDGEYHDNWDFYSDGKLTLRDVARLFSDYFDLNG